MKIDNSTPDPSPKARRSRKPTRPDSDRREEPSQLPKTAPTGEATASAPTSPPSSPPTGAPPSRTPSSGSSAAALPSTSVSFTRLRPRVRFQSPGVPPRVEDREPGGAVGEAAQADEQFAKQDDSGGGEADVVDDEFAGGDSGPNYPLFFLLNTNQIRRWRFILFSDLFLSFFLDFLA
ncbi:hypothetical protein U1Q18_002776 [Sarracenia purpurea var. burkii]